MATSDELRGSASQREYEGRARKLAVMTEWESKANTWRLRAWLLPHGQRLYSSLFSSTVGSVSPSLDEYNHKLTMIDQQTDDQTKRTSRPLPHCRCYVTTAVPWTFAATPNQNSGRFRASCISGHGKSTLPYPGLQELLDPVPGQSSRCVLISLRLPVSRFFCILHGK